MWMFLLACSSFDDLVPSEPARGPIPPLERRDGVLEAPAMVRPMPAPPPLVEVTDEELVDDFVAARPPYLSDVRAQALGNPDDPLFRELVERWADTPALPTARRLLDWVLADAESCRAVLEIDDGTLGAHTYDGCPWSMRSTIVARYPEAAELDAWRLTPLPDGLAAAFIEGTWLPDAVVRNYPDQRQGLVRRALERCADDSVHTGAACLQALTSIDWSSARERRSNVAEGPLSTLLDRFATGAELEDWLDAQGFAPRPDDAPVEAGSLMDRLRRRDALWEPEGSRERLALLLTQLGVNDAVVRSIPLDREGRYVTLLVHGGGQRYRVLLDPAYGPDTPQLIGLANRVARDAGVDARALWIEDDAVGWSAIVGPPAALAALVDAELVLQPEEPFRESLAPAPEPVDTGAPVDF